VKFHRDESPGPCRRAVWLVENQTLLGLHEFPDSSDTDLFDERRNRLDHLAFACGDRDEIEAWEVRLSELGIGNGGIVDADYGSALSCRDPDNIALEFFAPAL
jgi:glyoxylase I family protein